MSRTPAVLALATAALVAVTGCRPVHPGAAATVGHTRISVAQVQAATKANLAAAATGAAPAADSPDAERAALTTLIGAAVVNEAIAAKHATVSEGDVQDFLAKSRATYGSDEQTAQQYNIPVSSLHETAYRIVLAGKLEAALAPGQTDPTAKQTALSNYLVALSKQEGISVSPRYGTWDAAQGVVASDGFSTAVKSPIAAPAS